jgi:hypothetical protein
LKGADVEFADAANNQLASVARVKVGIINMLPSKRVTRKAVRRNVRLTLYCLA